MLPSQWHIRHMSRLSLLLELADDKDVRLGALAASNVVSTMAVSSGGVTSASPSLPMGIFYRYEGDVNGC